MKIKVVFTGGTIGSIAKENVVNIEENGIPQLIQMYNNKNREHKIEFDVESVLNILSENITRIEWKKLYEYLISIPSNTYDGIIMTHGTDTLAYTAALFSILLKDINIPIMIVSSDRPLEHELSNGYDNFVAAIDFIKTEGTKGVFVPFKQKETTIHLGGRIIPVQSFVHNFNSIGNVVYGKMVDGLFVRNNHEKNPTKEELEQSFFEKKIPFPEETSILCVNPYPGFNYKMIEFSKKPDVILHGLYHSSTACVTKEAEEYSILSFAKKCKTEDIKLYCASYDSNYSVYYSMVEMMEMGITFLENISEVMAYIKVMIAYGSFKEEAKRIEFLKTNIANEQFI
ncbi:MAG: asparaginase [Lachnospiraceae bacterium]